MKYIKTSLLSGLLGIGIGMIWYSAELLIFIHGNIDKLKAVTITGNSLLFWVSAGFLIGVFFYLAGLIFQKESWSLRKQVIVNFFICFAAWLVFELMVNDFNVSSNLLSGIFISFIVMYVIAYGGYFLKLTRDIAKINQKLKQVK